MFVAVLCLPLVQMNLHLFPDLKSEENRVFAAKPHTTGLSAEALRQYMKGYEQYFGDNFGFRNVLIRINSLINLRIFGVSPTPLPSMVVGKDGWLFYNDSTDGSSLVDYYGLVQFGGSKLSAIRKNMDRMRSICSAWGIQLIIVISPSKHTIYEEYLPSGIAMLKGNETRVDQLCEIWGENTTAASLIDLRAPLLHAKKAVKYPIYYKTDTHWNYLGSFLAYQEIMKKVRERHPDVKILELTDFTVSSAPGGSEDLAKTVSMDGLIADTEVILTPLKPYSAHREKVADSHYDFSLESDIKGSRAPKVLLFGDSFAKYLTPYLSESFSKGRYLASPPMADFSIVEKERPDVLIIELTERYAGSLKIRWFGTSARHDHPRRWIFPPS